MESSNIRNVVPLFGGIDVHDNGLVLEEKRKSLKSAREQKVRESLRGMSDQIHKEAWEVLHDTQNDRIIDQMANLGAFDLDDDISQKQHQRLQSFLDRELEEKRHQTQTLKQQDEEQKVRDLEHLHVMESFFHIQKRAQLLEKEAYKDPLTGVLNRRGGQQMWQTEVQKAKESGAPLSVAQIDIDSFKDFNTKYGHAAGDRVLQFLANTIIELFREDDTIVRLGGEEFAILLPNTSQTDAQHVISRILEEVRDRVCELPNGEMVAITFSGGVFQMTDQENSFESVLDKADKGLYSAKNAGKNQIHEYGMDMEKQEKEARVA